MLKRLVLDFYNTNSKYINTYYNIIYFILIEYKSKITYYKISIILIEYKSKITYYKYNIISYIYILI